MYFFFHTKTDNIFTISRKCWTKSMLTIRNFKCFTFYSCVKTDLWTVFFGPLKELPFGIMIQHGSASIHPCCCYYKKTDVCRTSFGLLIKVLLRTSSNVLSVSFVTSPSQKYNPGQHVHLCFLLLDAKRLILILCLSLLRLPGNSVLFVTLNFCDLLKTFKNILLFFIFITTLLCLLSSF